MNLYQENNKEQEQIISDNKNNRKNLNYIGISDSNFPISKKMITDRNIYRNRIIKPLKTFVYKSIFQIDKKTNNNNIASNDLSNKKHYEFNLSNQNHKNQMISDVEQQDYNYYNHNTYELDIDNNILNNELNNKNIINLNNIGQFLIKDITYNKQYFSKKEDKFNTYGNKINSNNDNYLNSINNEDNFNFQKSEDNLKKKI